jgi:hypothetical protein
MKTIIIFLFLVNGEVVKIPTTLAEDQTCSDRVLEIVKTNEEETRILYNGQIIFMHYCKTEEGEWVI